jgi:hypothetical protein
VNRQHYLDMDRNDPKQRCLDSRQLIYTTRMMEKGFASSLRDCIIGPNRVESH